MSNQKHWESENFVNYPKFYNVESIMIDDDDDDDDEDDDWW